MKGSTGLGTSGGDMLPKTPSTSVVKEVSIAKWMNDSSDSDSDSDKHSSKPLNASSASNSSKLSGLSLTQLFFLVLSRKRSSAECHLG